MPDDFLVARNPDGESKLPFLLRIPLGERGVVLKAREAWPRTSKVYCHRVEEWPADADVVERVPVRSCVQRGAAIDLVLDRARENRSQLVFTRAKGRPAVFWQTARTARQARPGVSVPSARASGVVGLQILVDARERYAYRFGDQQVVLEKAQLPAGDYGVRRDDRLLASVERKSLADLVSSLLSGKLGYQLAELASLPRAAVVVEDRYSAIFRLDRVRPAVVADALAECQVRWPQVPIVFCETRPLAQEWTYRFLAAAVTGLDEEEHGRARVAALADAPALAPPPPTPGQVREWARREGHAVSDRGRVPQRLVAAYLAAHGS